MILALLVMITALSISAVAIYYSIAGLVAIFAAAAIPIMIMGGVLEVGKLVTAVWLHRYWRKATWWLKSYLSIAVVVLMFITSMGIFGFLSKAHIEQTSAGEESVAQVERLSNEINRNTDIIKRAETKIKLLQTSGTGNDANIQSQIDKEQKRIDSAYERIQPAIDEQQAIIDSQADLYKKELANIDNDLAILQGYIDSGETKKAQQMIGASADGIFGKKTADKIGDWQKAKQKERAELISKIEKASNNPQAQAAREEIKRLRTTVETQIEQSNILINRLRSQLSNTDKSDDIDAQVDEQTDRIKKANSQIDTLTEEKYSLEGEYRKLEAEVGPIKYIAEFVYGENADNNMLEEAVRWVIIIIIFVFDPLAVLLLIASQYTFEWARKPEDNDTPPRGPEPEDPEPEDPEPPFTDEEWDEAHRENYEHDRAKKIDANEPPEIVRPTKEQLNKEMIEEDDLNKWNDWVEAANKEAEEELNKDTEDKEEKFKIIPELQEEIKNKKNWVQTNNPMFFANEAEEIKKKVKGDPTEYYDKEGFDQVKKSYTQNEEQSEGTLWSRVKRPSSE